MKHPHLLIAPPTARVAWSDLTPESGPRKDVLKAGDMVRKILVAVTPPASIDREAMELEAVVSGEATRDSYGDITRAEGWDFERWLKNPVVMWAHSYWIPPIATGLSIKVEKPSLISRMRFWNGDGEWGDFSREIFAMYANDPPFMRAFSVGFMPTKWNAMYEETDGGGRVFVGYDYLEKELWEYSAVPIPAYPDALARAADAGHVAAEDFTTAFSEAFKKAFPTLAGPGAMADSPVRPDELAELRSPLTQLWAQKAAGPLAAALRRIRHG